MKKSKTNAMRLIWAVLIGMTFYGCTSVGVGIDGELSITVPDDMMVDLGTEVELNASARHSGGSSVDVLWEITDKPSNSALTLSDANRETIIFMPDQIGEYELRFTATSEDGMSKSDRVKVTVIRAAILLSGVADDDVVLKNVYDDPADPDYIVRGIYHINKSLIVEEGVHIVFEKDAGLEINTGGSFRSVGSLSMPIVYTGVQKTQGYWKGLNVLSKDPSNRIEHASIQYTGSGGFDGANRKAGITLDNAILKVSNVHISNGEGYGLITRRHTDELPGFRDNVITDNKHPMHLNITQFHYLDASSDYSGNEEDYILSWGQEELNKDATWRNLNVPYKFRNGREYIESDLIIEKGTRLIGQNHSGLRIGDSGSLSAIGTSSQPIILEGMEDTEGYWEGVDIISNTNKNELRHVVIRNGGSSNFNDNAALSIDVRGRVKISNTRIEKSGNIGLLLAHPDVMLTQFSNNVITNNRTPVSCYKFHFHFFDDTSDLTGNENDEITAIWGNVGTSKDVTWKKTTVPYHITKSELISSNITVEPGVEMVFSDNTGLTIDKDGSFYAKGTPQEKIIFRGDRDVHGYWIGFLVYSNSNRNTFSNTELLHAGSKPFHGAKAALIVGDDAICSMYDSSVSHSGGYAIGIARRGQVAQARNVFDNNLQGNIYKQP